MRLREGVEADRGRRIDVQPAPFPEALAGAGMARGAALGGIMLHGGAGQSHGPTRHVEPAPKPLPAVATHTMVVAVSIVGKAEPDSLASGAALGGISAEGDVAQAHCSTRHVQPAP